jgi:hypothetical protein
MYLVLLFFLITLVGSGEEHKVNEPITQQHLEEEYDDDPNVTISVKVRLQYKVIFKTSK